MPCVPSPTLCHSFGRLPKKVILLGAAPLLEINIDTSSEALGNLMRKMRESSLNDSFLNVMITCVLYINAVYNFIFMLCSHMVKCFIYS